MNTKDIRIRKKLGQLPTDLDFKDSYEGFINVNITSLEKIRKLLKREQDWDGSFSIIYNARNKEYIVEMIADYPY